jgi:hypothetical protein
VSKVICDQIQSSSWIIPFSAFQSSLFHIKQWLESSKPRLSSISELKIIGEGECGVKTAGKEVDQ